MMAGIVEKQILKLKKMNPKKTLLLREREVLIQNIIFALMISDRNRDVFSIEYEIIRKFKDRELIELNIDILESLIIR